jgi:hypothetical protein
LKIKASGINHEFPGKNENTLTNKIVDQFAIFSVQIVHVHPTEKGGKERRRKKGYNFTI